MNKMQGQLKQNLDSIYVQYNKREFIDPDPLLYLYNYPDKQNREIVGIIAACFAYGQVLQIMKTVSHVLEKMTPSPHEYLIQRSRADMIEDFKGFRYRFADQTHLVNLLLGIQGVINGFSSLENCFYSGMSSTDENVLPGLAFFCHQLDPDNKTGHLLADPTKRSACKRSHLFLRWMVRKDLVDPGGWDQIAPARLIIPLDLHMHRIGNLLGFTSRKSADQKTALEVTRGFQKIIPHDPVKYDFCLTRYGIRNELSLEDLRQKVYH
ncbi:MAG: TIGR02757 family protein [Pseudomonadota bacterium]